MINTDRERILKAAMEAGCDEAERLGYDGTLGYAEAASISEKAAKVVLDRLHGLALTDVERERVLWWLNRPVPPGPAKELDVRIMCKIAGQ